MQYSKEFRDPKISKIIINEINRLAQTIDRQINIMEVCGGHTFAIFRFGINKVLPKNINLISGPGCPVCVTSQKFIDEAIEYSKLENTIIVTFGDIVRVPGSRSSLSKEKSNGAEVRICYSPMEALKIAESNPTQKIIFIGIGFETTAPLTASIIKEAKLRQLSNFFVLSAHKTMPNALTALLDSDKVQVNGLICPGHVTAITGLSIYENIAKNLGIPSVVCGFEPNDILQTILMILQQIQNHHSIVENQYKRGVRSDGNTKAQELIKEVFAPVDSEWRGIGTIPQSGLELSDNFSIYNIREHIQLDLPPMTKIKGCICGEIMQGIKKPTDCKLFAGQCTPQNPQGACMVSSEGGCATYYKFRE